MRKLTPPYPIEQMLKLFFTFILFCVLANISYTIDKWLRFKFLKHTIFFNFNTKIKLTMEYEFPNDYNYKFTRNRTSP